MCRYKCDESIKAQEKEVNWFIQNYRANHHKCTKNKDSDSKRILNYRGSFNEPLMIELSDRERKENSRVRKIHGYKVFRKLCKFFDKLWHKKFKWISILNKSIPMLAQANNKV